MNPLRLDHYRFNRRQPVIFAAKPWKKERMSKDVKCLLACTALICAGLLVLKFCAPV